VFEVCGQDETGILIVINKLNVERGQVGGSSIMMGTVAGGHRDPERGALGPLWE